MKKLIGLLGLLALLAVACGTSVQPPVFQPPVVTRMIDATSYPTVQAPQVNTNQSASGFSVSLQRAWRDGKQVYADVCYNLPDTSDWTIWAAHLEYGGQAISEFSSSMLSKQDAANGQPGQRCDVLNFYVPPDADLSSASLTIESLGAYPSSDEYCSLYMPKIQQKLDERGLRITLGCTDVNGTMTMQIMTKPDSMSQEEAEQVVFSDEFYTVPGPWSFQVSLGQ
ncbi:MAG: hypothetical protein HY258_04330 [Chloroflexi bacterium]|nr:hypothetical protein [Chloroflexota bacterium]